jgi:hypothetical protein
VRRLIRCEWTDEKLSYYLHALWAHGGQFMRALKSLGLYMLEGMENNHKATARLQEHTTKGGGVLRESVSEGVMKQQRRLLFNKVHEHWDNLTWERANVTRPTPTQSLEECLVEQSEQAQRKIETERTKNRLAARERRAKAKEAPA